MMLTRCPGCSTTFRVTPEQVKARHGKVRCGRCQDVFDAIEFLVDAAPGVPTPTPVPASSESQPAAPLTGAAEPTHEITAPAPSPSADAAVPPAAEADTENSLAANDMDGDAEPAESTDSTEVQTTATGIDTALLAADAPAAIVIAPSGTAPADEPATEAGEQAETLQVPDAAASNLAADASAPAEPPPESDILLQPSPLSTEYAQAKRLHMPRWPWTVAALLALLALIAQILIAFRTELSIKQPGLRPVLEMLCAQTGCVVDLPSDPDLVGIEASDLHPAPNGGLELTATVRNRAPYAQRWPDLELTLTDGTDKPIVRKVIQPAQYLPVTQSEEDGFPANSDTAIKLQLDAGTLPAMGYRLYLFYP